MQKYVAVLTHTIKHIYTSTEIRIISMSILFDSKR